MALAERAFKPLSGRIMTDMNMSGASAATRQGPLAVYQQRIATGDIKSDPDQARVVERLDQLWRELAAMPERPPQAAAPASKGRGFLAGLAKRLMNQPAQTAQHRRAVFIL